jgi:hypothetical protein
MDLYLFIQQQLKLHNNITLDFKKSGNHYVTTIYKHIMLPSIFKVLTNKHLLGVTEVNKNAYRMRVADVKVTLVNNKLYL